MEVNAPASDRKKLDFFELRKFKAEVDSLCKGHVKSLGHFHTNGTLISKNEKCSVYNFTSLLDRDKTSEDPFGKNISISSTVTCIKSLMLSLEVNPIEDFDFSKIKENLEKRYMEGEQPTRKSNDKLGEKSRGITTQGLQHKNPFTIGLLLPLLRLLNFSKDSELIKGCLESAEKHAKGDLSEQIRNTSTKSRPYDPQGVKIDKFPPNGFLTYWILVSLEVWSHFPKSKDGGNLISELAETLNWSKQEFYRQLSFFQAGDEEEADAFQLGYNLLIQYRFCRSDLRESIIELALATLFDAQLRRGVWEKKAPLFVYGAQGDAYCFSFEMLNSILGEFADRPDLISKFDSNLVQAFDWTKKNAIRDSNCGTIMWRSGHRVDNKNPESWATAEVYTFLQSFRSYLADRINKAILIEFRGRPAAPSQSSAFDSLDLPDVFLGSSAIPLDKLLKDRLLEPLKIQSVSNFSKTHCYTLLRNKNQKRLNKSGILFGPPGTGKTTIVKKIAAYLGWPMITINPSHFASDGIPLMPSTASRIFEKLIELEDVVVFFDELDVLIKDRDDKSAPSFEQAFLTNSLLPQLQDLADKASSLFFVATNYIDRLDSAATREGRFDFKIQILHPSVQAKLNMMISKPNILLSERDIKTLLNDDEILASSFKWATRGEIINLIKALYHSKSKADQKKKLKDYLKKDHKPKLMNENDQKKKEFERYNIDNIHNSMESRLE